MDCTTGDLRVDNTCCSFHVQYISRRLRRKRWLDQCCMGAWSFSLLSMGISWFYWVHIPFVAIPSTAQTRFLRYLLDPASFRYHRSDVRHVLSSSKTRPATTPLGTSFNHFACTRACCKSLPDYLLQLLLDPMHLDPDHS